MQQTSYGTLTITDTTDIARVQNWYLASSSSSGVQKTDGGWTTDVTNTNAIMTATKQYLWNYEQVQGEGANGNYITISTTNPVIIGRYGQNGGTGAAGRGITSIDEYYQVTNSTSKPGSSGWQKNTLVAPTSTKPYLWNYQVINYTNPTSTQGTYNDARIIGVYGDKGDKGDDGRTYFLELSNTTVKKSANNTLTPTSVTIKAYYRDGVKTKTAYSGRIVIIGNKSDNTTTTISTTNNSSASLTVNATYVSYTINLYEAGGTTNLFATETLPIVSDGVSVSNVTSSKSGDTTTITITYSDGRTPSTFIVKDGAQGGKGDTGATAQWYYGTDLSHTSGTATLATSKTSGVVVGSMYLNPDTSLCYRCTAVSGSNATWTYAGDLTTGVINNIEIGGRNLILCGNLNYSSTLPLWKSWATVSAREIVTINNEKWMHITANGTNYGGYSQDSYGDAYPERVIYPNTNYIVSFDAYASVENTPLVTWFHWRSSDDGANIGQQNKITAISTTRKRYSVQFVSSSSSTYNIDRFCLMIGSATNASNGAQLYITNIKIEQGNIATEYTPAPEDINALSGLVSSLQTQLDGKIETWAQSTNPATWNSADNDKHVGDLWYYTGNTTGNYVNNTTYKYTKSGSNYSWQTYTQGTDLFTKINGKSTIFYGTTNGTYTGVQVGDYLVDSTDGSSYRWTGSTWEKVVDSVEVGGRNLILKSSTTSEWPFYNPNTYQIARVNLTEDFVRGETYTVTIWGGPVTRSDKTSCHYSCYWGGGNFVLGSTSMVKDGVYSKTFTVSTTSTASVTNPLEMYIFNTPPTGASGTTYSAPITKIKLEKGNTPTDWSPAPEDTEAAIDTVKTDFSFANETMSSLIQKANNDNSKLIEQLSKIEQTLNEIKLRVSSVANNKTFYAGEDISSYITEEPPTLLNYPTFTDFFIWPVCNTTLSCDDTLNCGTNNYAAYENRLAHCITDDTYYIFKKDAANEYYWENLTFEEYKNASSKFSSIDIKEDQISIVSALNSDLTELLINYNGITTTSGKLFCC